MFIILRYVLNIFIYVHYLIAYLDGPCPHELSQFLLSFIHLSYFAFQFSRDISIELLGPLFPELCQFKSGILIWDSLYLKKLTTHVLDSKIHI